MLEAIRAYILQRQTATILAGIDIDAIRQQAIEEATATILADLQENGITEADRAVIDAVLANPA